MSGNPIKYPVPPSLAQLGLERLYANSQITELIPISTGFANSIFSFKKDGSSLILRMPPSIDPALVREVEVMKALFREGIPVPKVLEFDPANQNAFGHPFMIMERLSGKNLLVTIESLNGVKRDNLMVQIAETLHRIHEVHSTDLNVMKFTTLQSFIDDGLSSIKRFATLSDVKDFGNFGDWLQKNRPGEATYNKAFIHNDFHGYNIMVDNGRLSGILDWNSAVIAEEQVDVAFFSLLTEACGYPELANDFISKYRQISDLELGELNYYMTAIAILKILQVPLQEKQMIETGQIEKADELRSILNRVRKGFIKTIEENTNLSANVLWR